MTVKKIRIIGDPVLREKSKEIKEIDKIIIELVEDMVDTITKGKIVAAGLAAPQIGVSKRVIIVNFGEKIKAFINPEIEVLDNEQIIDEEGCLSVGSYRYNVGRVKKIKVKAIDLEGNENVFEAEGLLSRIFQHEVDHLNGILFIDHLDKETKRELLSKISKVSEM